MARADRNGCDLSGDAIQYLRERDGIGDRGSTHAARSATLLWSEEGARARTYLHQCGLLDGVRRSCWRASSPPAKPASCCT